MFPPGTSRAAYVVEKQGRIIRLAGGKRSVFLDARKHVTSGGERGLLSVAFAPAFADNGSYKKTTANRCYVNYTAASHTFVDELPVGKGSPMLASFQRKRTLLKIRQPYSNHNGGQIMFGPDGLLYVGMGDGGSGGDPRGYGQNTLSLLGKMLRIDPNGSPYRVPKDNPFVGKRNFRPEIFAYGLRNSWRFSFDRATGKLYAGDVGQNREEEIDIVEAGDNLGWAVMEGRSCHRPRSGCESTGLKKPLHSYGRSVGRSVTGGFVYRGRKLPGRQGRYFFADYVSGKVFSLPVDGKKGGVETVFSNLGGLSGFGEDTDGELYLTEHGSGLIYKIVPEKGN